ncbi:MAG: DUF1326 domain-containing protein [Acidobacteriota bacterium]
MRNSLIAVLSLLTASQAFPAGFTKTEIRGEYVEARNADVYTGPCFANGEVGQVGDLAVFGWTIEKGSFEGTSLDGLSVVGVVRASNTLGAGVAVLPASAVLIIDQRADPEQRLALKSFAQRAGGELLQDVVKVDYAPISFTLKDNNLHSATAILDAQGLARIETRALMAADNICHNEETFYPPLNRLDHAMPAYTVANRFDGDGLGTKWSSPGKRSAFVGSFHFAE